MAKSGILFAFISLQLINCLCSGFVIKDSNLLQVQELLQNASRKEIIHAVSNRLSNHFRHLQNPAFPLLPLLPGYPFPDYICYKPTTLETTLLDLPNLKVDLKIDFNKEMVTSGLDSLKDLLTFKVMPSGAVVLFWKISLPLLEMIADYDINLIITDKTDSTKDVTFHIGSTNGQLKSEDYFLSLFAEAKAFPLYEKLMLTQLNWDKHIPEIVWSADWLVETIAADGTHTELINGPGDIGAVLTAIFNLIWGGIVAVDIHCFINYAINDCSVSQLVNEEYTCLKWDIENSPCFNDPRGTSMRLDWGDSLAFETCEEMTTNTATTVVTSPPTTVVTSPSTTVVTSPPTTVVTSPPTTVVTSPSTTVVTSPPTTVVTSPPTTVVTSPSTTVVTSPPTTVVTSPPTTEVTSPSTTVVTSPPTTVVTSPPTTVVTSPPTTVVTSPSTTVVTSPPTTVVTSPPTTVVTSPSTTVVTSPPTTVVTSPPTTVVTSPPTTVVTSPSTTVVTSPPTTVVTSPPTTVVTSPSTTVVTSPPTTVVTSPPTTVVTSPSTTESGASMSGCLGRALIVLISYLALY